MIPYTSRDDPDWKRPNSETRPDNEKFSPFRGGTRCVEQAQTYETLRNVPVIFLTILDPETVLRDTIYVGKSGDEELTDFLTEAARILEKM
jgi:hypothetical protein